jgi:hypothetical protein
MLDPVLAAWEPTSLWGCAVRHAISGVPDSPPDHRVPAPNPGGTRKTAPAQTSGPTAMPHPHTTDSNPHQEPDNRVSALPLNSESSSG